MVATSRSRRPFREAAPPPYRPPESFASILLRDLLTTTGRKPLADKQLDLLRTTDATPDVTVYYAGQLDLLSRLCVSVVGTREVTDEGRSRTRRLARELVEAGVVIVSGLAKGVDTAAHTSAIEQNGYTIGVIGTPLNRVYPAENACLQQTIYEKYLLLTPFRNKTTVYRSNFPKRNRVMAAVSDATVIVEASNTSGALHQASECQRLGRWLFIPRAVVNNKGITWPERFLNEPNTIILERTEQILDALDLSPRISSKNE
jgi:DNA processing protein